MEQYLIFGKNGRLLTGLIEVKKEGPIRSPSLIEIDSCSLCSIQGTYRSSCMESFLEHMQSVYYKWKRFGHYGDMILVTIEGDPQGGAFNFVINFIGRFSFPKGVLAVDLLPYVYDGAGNVFFVGTKRPVKKGNPHSGKPAFIGGHIDLKEKYFESALEAAFREGHEEVKLRLAPARWPWTRKKDLGIGKVPVTPELDVRFKLGTHEGLTKVELISTMRPDEGEMDESMANRRVDWTFVYLCPIPLPQIKLTKQALLSMLSGGEDEPMVIDMKRDKKPKFAFAHHQKAYDQMAEEMKRRVRRSGLVK